MLPSRNIRKRGSTNPSRRPFGAACPARLGKFLAAPACSPPPLGGAPPSSLAAGALGAAALPVPAFRLPRLAPRCPLPPGPPLPLSPCAPLGRGAVRLVLCAGGAGAGGLFRSARRPSPWRLCAALCRGCALLLLGKAAAPPLVGCAPRPGLPSAPRGGAPYQEKGKTKLCPSCGAG